MKISAAVLMCLSAHSAEAQTQNFHASLSAGQSRFNLFCAGLEICDKTSVAQRLTLGYQITRIVSIEAMYASLGKSELQFSLTPGKILFTESIRAYAKGAGVRVRVPFDTDGRVAGIARVGIARTHLEFTGAIPGLPSIHEDETHKRLYGGIGVDVSVTERIALGLTYDLVRVPYSRGSQRVETLGAVLTTYF